MSDMPKCSFAVGSFVIPNTRSLHKDTDYISGSVAGGPARKMIQKLGDLEERHLRYCDKIQERCSLRQRDGGFQLRHCQQGSHRPKRRREDPLGASLDPGREVGSGRCGLRRGSRRRPARHCSRAINRQRPRRTSRLGGVLRR
jgi:hypothetical protein